METCPIIICLITNFPLLQFFQEHQSNLICWFHIWSRHILRELQEFWLNFAKHKEHEKFHQLWQWFFEVFHFSEPSSQNCQCTQNQRRRMQADMNSLEVKVQSSKWLFRRNCQKIILKLHRNKNNKSYFVTVVSIVFAWAFTDAWCVIFRSYGVLNSGSGKNKN